MDLTKLPLTPLEGFVLSRIDGLAPVAVLSDLTNLDEGDVATIVERLIELGAAEWVRESVSLPRATGRAATLTPSSPIVAPPSLRASGVQAARVNVPRPIRPPARSPSTPLGAYREQAPKEERIDPTRHSVLPSSMPRASHTGTRQPVGELEVGDDLGNADTMRPPEPDPMFDEPAKDASGPRVRTARLAASPPPDAAAASEPPRASEPLTTSEPPRASEPLTTSEPPRASEPPSEGAEALDLDPERMKRIDDLYLALDLLDHYRVLGVEREADRGDVRAAYFQLSKVFHPDTMFRKRLGPYKAKMEAIFNRLTEAYEVLGKKRSRQEYDRYLALQDRTRAAEATLEDAPAAPEPLADEPVAEASATPEPVVEAPAAEASATPEPPHEPTPTRSAPAREPSERGRALARELMAKKLRNAARAAQAARPEVPSAPAPDPIPAGKDHTLRSLASSLRASAAHTGGFDRVQRHMLEARRAERAGDLATAAREVRLASAMAPDREDVKAELARVNAALASSLAASYEEQAMYEQRHGKWGAAALSWAKVSDGRPDDARPARLAAEALMEANGDLHRAKELAQRAVDLAPNEIGGLRVLARVYIAAGLQLNARRVLQRAATLDPSDEMVENLLRELDR